MLAIIVVVAVARLSATTAVLPPAPAVLAAAAGAPSGSCVSAGICPFIKCGGCMYVYGANGYAVYGL